MEVVTFLLFYVILSGHLDRHLGHTIFFYLL